MNKLQKAIRRQTADGVVDAVAKGGRIQLVTVAKLLRLLQDKTDYPHWPTVEVVTGAMVKTIDNEVDAQETIRRLREKPDKETE
jgi:hypothetical protein